MAVVLVVGMIFAALWLVATFPFAFAEAAFSWRSPRHRWAFLTPAPACTIFLLCAVFGGCGLDTTSAEYQRAAAQCEAGGGHMKSTSDGPKCFYRGKQTSF